MPDSIEEIRRRIEADHQEAVRALAVLEKYLGNGNQPAQKDIADHFTPPSPRRYKKGGKSINGRVLAVTNRGWTTAQKIHAETGLTIQQVRGVLNAPRLRAVFEKREVNGHTEYRSDSPEKGLKEPLAGGGRSQGEQA